MNQMRLLALPLAVLCMAPVCHDVWGDNFVTNPNLPRSPPCVGSYWACNIASGSASPLALPCGAVFCAGNDAEATAAALLALGEATVPPGLQCAYIGEALMAGVFSGSNEAIWASWIGVCLSPSSDGGACKHTWEDCTEPPLGSANRQSDCCPGLICEDLDYEHYVCCVRSGQPCSVTSECCGSTYNATIECVIGICENTCLELLGLGHDGDPCSSNHDCASCVCDALRGCDGDAF